MKHRLAKKSIKTAAITAVMAAVFCTGASVNAQAAEYPANVYRQAEQSAYAQTDRTKAAAADETSGVSAYAQTDAGRTLSLYAASDEIEAAYEATGAYLLTLDTPQVGSTYGEWLVLGLARAGIISDAFVQGYAANVETYVAENGSATLSSTKSTENSRVILALTSIGYDVTDVAGYNLLEPLADLTYVCKQGVNGMIFALIALDAGDYEIPEAEDGATQTTREGLISAILQFTTEDGGFSFTSGGDYDIDITAMALQGLAPYYGTDDDVTAAVDNALLLFESIQGDDGYFGDDPCTAAQVVTALCTLGIDPATDERFVKNGLSVMDELLDFYLEDTGGFSYYAGKDYNEMATEQAYYALVSYARLVSGQSALYNMTDTAYSTPATGGTDSSTDTSAGSGTDEDTDTSDKSAESGSSGESDGSDPDTSASDTADDSDGAADSGEDESDADTGSGSDTEEDADTEAAADDIAVAADADTADRSGLYMWFVVFAGFAGAAGLAGWKVLRDKQKTASRKRPGKKRFICAVLVVTLFSVLLFTGCTSRSEESAAASSAASAQIELSADPESAAAQDGTADADDPDSAQADDGETSSKAGGGDTGSGEDADDAENAASEADDSSGSAGSSSDSSDTSASSGSGSSSSSGSSKKSSSSSKKSSSKSSASSSSKSSSSSSKSSSSSSGSKTASNTCTISIDCSTILDNLDQLDSSKVSIVPSDGVILATTEVEFDDGDTVYDVLYDVCKSNKIHMEQSGGYIEGIANLYEFDCGSESGWMYSVNGDFPNVGCKQYDVESGDVIAWVYTCDLGKDVGDNSMY